MLTGWRANSQAARWGTRSSRAQRGCESNVTIPRSASRTGSFTRTAKLRPVARASHSLAASIQIHSPGPRLARGLRDLGVDLRERVAVVQRVAEERKDRDHEGHAALAAERAHRLQGLACCHPPGRVVRVHRLVPADAAAVLRRG